MPAVRLQSVLSVLLFAACSVAVAEPPTLGIRWHYDLDQAQAIAKKEGKLLLVHFWSNNCGPCVALDTRVFNQPNVASVIHASYVPVKLNASDYPATAERFGIVRVPTDVVITTDGTVLDKNISPATPMAFAGKMGQIAQLRKHQQGRNFATVGTNPSGGQSLNRAYANLRTPTQGQAAPNAQTPPEGLTSNPYAQNGVAPAPPKPSDVPAQVPTKPNRYAAVAAPIEPVTTTNPYANQPEVPVAPIQEQSPVVATEPTQAPATNARTTDAVATNPGMQVAQATGAKPELPNGAPELGFYGFCPVTLKREFKWAKGDVQWGAIHRGRTYLFASAEYRDEFLKNGDAFAPVLSGIDPVLALEYNQVKPGLRKYGAEFQGQFYLFANAETMRQFWKKPDRYSAGVRQAMNRGDQPLRR